MKKILYSLILLFFISTIFFSCKKEPGCMDPTSMTFNPEAKKDDGSCVYAYDVAIGDWNISPDCEEINIPIIGAISLNDQLPESINIQGSGDNSLFIDIDGTQITGDIDFYGIITIPSQTVQIDPGLGVPLDVEVEGSGQVYLDNTGDVSLTYSFEIPIVGGSESILCNIILDK